VSFLLCPPFCVPPSVAPLLCPPFCVPPPPFVFSQTLPADRVSTENGAIVMSSGRWPLLVDPQLQAIHWLKGMYKDKVDVVRLSSVDLLRKMSTAIKEGRTIIIENMLEDGPDAALMPVIARQIKVRVDCTQVVQVVQVGGGTRCVTSSTGL
jgi:hypothetical protein